MAWLSIPFGDPCSRRNCDAAPYWACPFASSPFRSSQVWNMLRTIRAPDRVGNSCSPVAQMHLGLSRRRGQLLA
eukprot:5233664-Alexandrium_andersonii.AAC.1